MATVVVQDIHGRKRPLAVGNEHVGRHHVVSAQAYFYLPRLVAVSLFLEDYLSLIAVGRRGGRGKHAVEHLLAGHIFPDCEVLDVAMPPGKGIVKVGNQRVGVGRQIAHKLILLAPLRRSRQVAEEQDGQKDRNNNGFHGFYGFSK